jgi:hypothetical protein
MTKATQTPTPKYTRAKKVERAYRDTWFNLEENVSLFCKVDKTFVEIVVKKENRIILEVTDLDTGVEGVISVNKVLKSKLEEAYPENGYVDKKFEIVKLPREAGKRYFNFDLYEIE